MSTQAEATGPIDIYARVSRKGDKEMRSTAGQVAVCRSALSERGLSPGKVLVDDGKSAWNPRVVRKDWDELMGRLESGASAGVIVFDLERFSRQPPEAERLIAAADGGMLVLDSDGEYDLTTASGKKGFRDAVVAAAYYSDRLSGRVQRGKRLKASNGEVNMSIRPFGFTLLPKGQGLEPHPQEAPILQDLTRRLLAGESQDALLTDLHARGILTTRGKQWTRPGLKQALTRPINCGHVVHTDQKTGITSVVARLPGEPVITEDDFERVLALFASRRPGRPPSPAYLCSGLATCECGQRMNGRPVPNRKPYEDGTPFRQYRCTRRPGKLGCGRNSIDQRQLDTLARALTIEILSDVRQAGQIEAAAAEIDEQIADLDTKIDAKERLALQLADRLGRDEITLDRYDAATAPLDRDLAKLRAQRDALTDPGAPVVRAAGAGNWPERWAAADSAERRAFLWMALRGRPLVVARGPAGDLATVGRRVNIGEP